MAKLCHPADSLQVAVNLLNRRHWIQNILAPADKILNKIVWPTLKRLSCMPATLALKWLAPLFKQDPIFGKTLMLAETVLNYTHCAKSS
jgi:hypothetical protein